MLLFKEYNNEPIFSADPFSLRSTTRRQAQGPLIMLPINNNKKSRNPKITAFFIVS